MDTAATLLRRLRRWGRPAPATCFTAHALLGFETGLLFMPLAAVWMRLEFGRYASLAEPLGWLLGGVVVLGIVVGLLAVSVRRSNPLLAARQLDRATGGHERFLTAADAARRGRRGPFVDLLTGGVMATLDERRRLDRPKSRMRIPSIKRFLLCLLITILILLLPSWMRGLAGDARAAGAGDAVVEGGAGQADESGETRTFADLAGRVRITVSTDRSVYLLGEDIRFKVRLKTLEASPAGIPLACHVRVNGEHVLKLPLDWTLPAEAEVELEQDWVMNGPLEEKGLYKRGLVTFDTIVMPARRDAPLEGVAPGNRVTIQISENVNKRKTRYPQHVEKQKKKKQERKPRNKEKPNEDPNENKKPKKKKQRPQKGPDPKPPGEIEATPHVVEPMFTGDQTKKRDVRVYDRDIEKADDPEREKPAPVDASRAYQKGKETEIIKMPLSARERSLVRRYMEAIRPGGDKK